MGGLQRVLIEVLQNIDKLKYEIILFIEDESGEENVFLKDIPEGIKIYFLKPEALLRKTEYHRNKRKNFYHRILYNYMKHVERGVILGNTKKYLKEIGKVDLFIDYDWGATKYVDKLGIENTVVWIHSSVPHLLGNKSSKIKRFGERLRKYKKIVAICDEMKDEIEEIYPYLKGKIERIYNPFNFERVEKLAICEDNITKEQKKLMKEKYCVAVSRLDNVQKDYPTLLKAFKILKDKGIKEKLYIIGDGHSKDEIKQLILKLELQDTVKLLGLQKNPYIWMKNSDFFVHSSKYEGFGLVLIEAALVGKAIISSSCPVGPRELLNNGECGMLFDVGDSNQLAEHLEVLIKNEYLKEEYVKKMRLRIEEFNREVVIKDYEKFIDSFL